MLAASYVKIPQFHCQDKSKIMSLVSNVVGPVAYY